MMAPDRTVLGINSGWRGQRRRGPQTGQRPRPFSGPAILMKSPPSRSLGAGSGGRRLARSGRQLSGDGGVDHPVAQKILLIPQGALPDRVRSDVTYVSCVAPDPFPAPPLTWHLPTCDWPRATEIGWERPAAIFIAMSPGIAC